MERQPASSPAVPRGGGRAAIIDWLAQEYQRTNANAENNAEYAASHSRLDAPSTSGSGVQSGTTSGLQRPYSARNSRRSLFRQGDTMGLSRTAHIPPSATTPMARPLHHDFLPELVNARGTDQLVSTPQVPQRGESGLYSTSRSTTRPASAHSRVGAGLGSSESSRTRSAKRVSTPSSTARPLLATPSNTSLIAAGAVPLLSSSASSAQDAGTSRSHGGDPGRHPLAFLTSAARGLVQYNPNAPTAPLRPTPKGRSSQQQQQHQIHQALNTPFYYLFYDPITGTPVLSTPPPASVAAAASVLGARRGIPTAAGVSIGAGGGPLSASVFSAQPLPHGEDDALAEERRNLVLSFLQSDECTLFSDCTHTVEATDSDLDLLLRVPESSLAIYATSGEDRQMTEEEEARALAEAEANVEARARKCLGLAPTVGEGESPMKTPVKRSGLSASEPVKTQPLPLGLRLLKLLNEANRRFDSFDKAILGVKALVLEDMSLLELTSHKPETNDDVSVQETFIPTYPSSGPPQQQFQQVYKPISTSGGSNTSLAPTTPASPEKSPLLPGSELIMKLSCENLPSLHEALALHARRVAQNKTRGEGGLEQSSLEPDPADPPKPSAVLVLWKMHPTRDEYLQLTQTELRRRTANPQFSTPISIQEDITSLKICAYDLSNAEKVMDEDFICSLRIRFDRGPFGNLVKALVNEQITHLQQAHEEASAAFAKNPGGPSFNELYRRFLSLRPVPTGNITLPFSLAPLVLRAIHEGKLPRPPLGVFPGLSGVDGTTHGNSSASENPAHELPVPKVPLLHISVQILPPAQLPTPPPNALLEITEHSNEVGYISPPSPVPFTQGPLALTRGSDPGNLPHFPRRRSHARLGESGSPSLSPSASGPSVTIATSTPVSTSGRAETATGARESDNNALLDDIKGLVRAQLQPILADVLKAQEELSRSVKEIKSSRSAPKVRRRDTSKAHQDDEGERRSQSTALIEVDDESGGDRSTSPHKRPPRRDRTSRAILTAAAKATALAVSTLNQQKAGLITHSPTKEELEHLRQELARVNAEQKALADELAERSAGAITDVLVQVQCSGLDPTVSEYWLEACEAADGVTDVSVSSAQSDTHLVESMITALVPHSEAGTGASKPFVSATEIASNAGTSQIFSTPLVFKFYANRAVNQGVIRVRDAYGLTASQRATKERVSNNSAPILGQVTIDLRRLTSSTEPQTFELATTNGRKLRASVTLHPNRFDERGFLKPLPVSEPLKELPVVISRGWFVVTLDSTALLNICSDSPSTILTARLLYVIRDKVDPFYSPAAVYDTPIIFDTEDGQGTQSEHHSTQLRMVIRRLDFLQVALGPKRRSQARPELAYSSGSPAPQDGALLSLRDLASIPFLHQPIQAAGSLDLLPSRPTLRNNAAYAQPSNRAWNGTRRPVQRGERQSASQSVPISVHHAVQKDDGMMLRQCNQSNPATFSMALPITAFKNCANEYRLQILAAPQATVDTSRLAGASQPLNALRDGPLEVVAEAVLDAQALLSPHSNETPSNGRSADCCIVVLKDHKHDRGVGSLRLCPLKRAREYQAAALVQAVVRSFLARYRFLRDFTSSIHHAEFHIKAKVQFSIPHSASLDWRGVLRPYALALCGDEPNPLRMLLQHITTSSEEGDSLPSRDSNLPQDIFHRPPTPYRDPIALQQYAAHADLAAALSFTELLSPNIAQPSLSDSRLITLEYEHALTIRYSKQHSKHSNESNPANNTNSDSFSGECGLNDPVRVTLCRETQAPFNVHTIGSSDDGMPNQGLFSARGSVSQFSFSDMIANALGLPMSSLRGLPLRYDEESVTGRNLSQSEDNIGLRGVHLFLPPWCIPQYDATLDVLKPPKAIDPSAAKATASGLVSFKETSHALFTLGALLSAPRRTLMLPFIQSDRQGKSTTSRHSPVPIRVELTAVACVPQTREAYHSKLAAVASAARTAELRLQAWERSRFEAEQAAYLAREAQRQAFIAKCTEAARLAVFDARNIALAKREALLELPALRIGLSCKCLPGASPNPIAVVWIKEKPLYLPYQGSLPVAEPRMEEPQPRYTLVGQTEWLTGTNEPVFRFPLTLKVRHCLQPLKVCIYNVSDPTSIADDSVIAMSKVDIVPFIPESVQEWVKQASVPLALNEFSIARRAVEAFISSQTHEPPLTSLFAPSEVPMIYEKACDGYVDGIEHAEISAQSILQELAKGFRPDNTFDGPIEVRLRDRAGREITSVESGISEGPCFPRLLVRRAFAPLDSAINGPDASDPAVLDTLSSDPQGYELIEANSANEDTSKRQVRESDIRARIHFLISRALLELERKHLLLLKASVAEQQLLHHNPDRETELETELQRHVAQVWPTLSSLKLLKSQGMASVGIYISSRHLDVTGRWAGRLNSSSDKGNSTSGARVDNARVVAVVWQLNSAGVYTCIGQTEVVRSSNPDFDKLIEVPYIIPPGNFVGAGIYNTKSLPENGGAEAAFRASVGDRNRIKIALYEAPDPVNNDAIRLTPSDMICQVKLNLGELLQMAEDMEGTGLSSAPEALNNEVIRRSKVISGMPQLVPARSLVEERFLARQLLQESDYDTMPSPPTLPLELPTASPTIFVPAYDRDGNPIDAVSDRRCGVYVTLANRKQVKDTTVAAAREQILDLVVSELERSGYECTDNALFKPDEVSLTEEDFRRLAPEKADTSAPSELSRDENVRKAASSALEAEPFLRFDAPRPTLPAIPWSLWSKLEDIANDWVRDATTPDPEQLRLAAAAQTTLDLAIKLDQEHARREQERIKLEEARRYWEADAKEQAAKFRKALYEQEDDGERKRPLGQPHSRGLVVDCDGVYHRVRSDFAGPYYIGSAAAITPHDEALVKDNSSSMLSTISAPPAPGHYLENVAVSRRLSMRPLNEEDRELYGGSSSLFPMSPNLVGGVTPFDPDSDDPLNDREIEQKTSNAFASTPGEVGGKLSLGLLSPNRAVERQVSLGSIGKPASEGGLYRSDLEHARRDSTSSSAFTDDSHIEKDSLPSSTSSVRGLRTRAGPSTPMNRPRKQPSSHGSRRGSGSAVQTLDLERDTGVVDNSGSRPRSTSGSGSGSSSDTNSPPGHHRQVSGRNPHLAPIPQEASVSLSNSVSSQNAGLAISLDAAVKAVQLERQRELEAQQVGSKEQGSAPAGQAQQEPQQASHHQHDRDAQTHSHPEVGTESHDAANQLTNDPSSELFNIGLAFRTASLPRIMPDREAALAAGEDPDRPLRTLVAVYQLIPETGAYEWVGQTETAYAAGQAPPEGEIEPPDEIAVQLRVTTFMERVELALKRDEKGEPINTQWRFAIYLDRVTGTMIQSEDLLGSASVSLRTLADNNWEPVILKVLDINNEPIRSVNSKGEFEEAVLEVTPTFD